LPRVKVPRRRSLSGIQAVAKALAKTPELQAEYDAIYGVPGEQLTGGAVSSSAERAFAEWGRTNRFAREQARQLSALQRDMKLLDDTDFAVKAVAQPLPRSRSFSALPRPARTKWPHEQYRDAVEDRDNAARELEQRYIAMAGPVSATARQRIIDDAYQQLNSRKKSPLEHLRSEYRQLNPIFALAPGDLQPEKPVIEKGQPSFAAPYYAQARPLPVVNPESREYTNLYYGFDQEPRGPVGAFPGRPAPGWGGPGQAPGRPPGPPPPPPAPLWRPPPGARGPDWFVRGRRGAPPGSVGRRPSFSGHGPSGYRPGHQPVYPAFDDPYNSVSTNLAGLQPDFAVPQLPVGPPSLPPMVSGPTVHESKRAYSTAIAHAVAQAADAKAARALVPPLTPAGPDLYRRQHSTHEANMLAEDVGPSPWPAAPLQSLDPAARALAIDRGFRGRPLTPPPARRRSVSGPALAPLQVITRPEAKVHADFADVLRQQDEDLKRELQGIDQLDQDLKWNEARDILRGVTRAEEKELKQYQAGPSFLLAQQADAEYRRRVAQDSEALDEAQNYPENNGDLAMEIARVAQGRGPLILSGAQQQQLREAEAAAQPSRLGSVARTLGRAGLATARATGRVLGALGTRLGDVATRSVREGVQGTINAAPALVRRAPGVLGAVARPLALLVPPGAGAPAPPVFRESRGHLLAQPIVVAGPVAQAAAAADRQRRRNSMQQLIDENAAQGIAYRGEGRYRKPKYYGRGFLFGKIAREELAAQRRGETEAQAKARRRQKMEEHRLKLAAEGKLAGGGVDSGTAMGRPNGQSGSFPNVWFDGSSGTGPQGTGCCPWRRTNGGFGADPGYAALVSIRTVIVFVSQ
jgi:hypothetical protein